jgi:hypothetical protein
MLYLLILCLHDMEFRHTGKPANIHACLFHNYFEPLQKMQQSSTAFATWRPRKNVTTANQCRTWKSLIRCNICLGNFYCEQSVKAVVQNTGRYI